MGFYKEQENPPMGCEARHPSAENTRVRVAKPVGGADKSVVVMKQL